MLATIRRRKRDLRLAPARDKNCPRYRLNCQANTIVGPDPRDSALYPQQGAYRTVFCQKDCLAHADDRLGRSVERLKSCGISKPAGHIDITGAADGDIVCSVIRNAARLNDPE